MLWLYRWEEEEEEEEEYNCRQLTIPPEKVLISFFFWTYYRGKGVIFWPSVNTIYKYSEFQNFSKKFVALMAMFFQCNCSFFCVWCVWRHPVSDASQFVKLAWRKEEEDRLTLKGPPKIICHKSEKKEKQSGFPFDTQMLLSLGDKALPFDWRNKYEKAK